MTEQMYFKLNSFEHATEIDADMFFDHVSEDGVNFKFPFQSGTTNYIDPTKWEMAYAVDERFIASAQNRQNIADAIANQKTKSQAIAAGWLPEPISL